jgi:GDP-L-fucose synthase
MKEEYLLSGPLEETNEAYAVAKITAIKLCRYYNEQYGTNFISVMPTNLYGPGDNFDLNNSHVLPALIRKFHDAKVSGRNLVELWGDGSPYREFLYSDDLADAVVFLMERYDYKDIGEFVNIGSGVELTIRELAEKIRTIVFGSDKTCRIQWDPSKPNGTPRKLLDVSKLNKLGWKAKISLDEGLRRAYKEYKRGKDA